MGHLSTNWILRFVLPLDSGDRGIHILGIVIIDVIIFCYLGDHVASVEKTAGHILAVPWAPFHHLVGGLEVGVVDFSHTELLMVGCLGGDNQGVGGEWEVDPGEGHQVGLELGQVHTQGPVEPEAGSDGGNDLDD